ncbi:MAG: hypothetical protein GFH27_549331n5 [Chloroflexi bacterium AL-W]|nr:hypothetical protein [Chloroflexi bacterium AL-N1]NOK70306.1 hypothetical protein [Chloroflexi bacterium AL-N10]NOK77984.1 hypothetical protein [Chloroflexi bacterium AL-N5]NOK85083.1 hypothetical protein [Chloroflexi bacterium AL-W]
MKITSITNVLLILLGSIILVNWLFGDTRMPLQLLMSLILISAGVTNLFMDTQRQHWSLFVQYFIAVMILLLALFYSPTVFFGSVGLITLVVALINTFWKTKLQANTKETDGL